MSGRNNRIVRNRERSSNFNWDANILKTVTITLIAILIVIIAIIAVFKTKTKKNVEFVAGLQDTLFYEYFILSSEQGIGVIDKTGKVVLEPNYSRVEIPNPAKDVFIAYTENGYEILNQKGEKILTDYELVEAVKSSDDTNEIETEVLKYKKDGLYGLINLEGTIVTEALFDEITSLDYRPGRILVKKDEKYGILDVNRKCCD